jgi:hypothetical protein
MLFFSRIFSAVMVPVLRFLAIPLLIIAVLALVADGTRILNGAGIAFTTTQEHWSRMAPQSLAAAKTSLSKATHVAVWDSGVQRILAIPAFALFGVVGGLLAFAGRRRRRVNIFAN